MSYTPSGNPQTGSEGLSALIRAEFLSISHAFDALPPFTATGAFTTAFVQTGNHTFTLPAVDGTLATTTDVSSAVAAEASARTTAIGGAFPTSHVNLNANTTINSTYNGKLCVLGPTDSLVMSLVSPVTVSGMTVGFFCLTANGFTLNTPAGQIFGGGISTISLAAPTNSFICLHSDGVNWLVFSASPNVLGYTFP